MLLRHLTLHNSNNNNNWNEVPGQNNNNVAILGVTTILYCFKCCYSV